ncbi:heparinase II/III-like protein [Janthinobacterium sp. HH106]|nr:heparinase II/III-like protein [Janthinobacterium sp. HH106]
MRQSHVALLLSVCIGGAHAAPAILAFDADHLKVVEGQPVRLHWEVSGAATVTLNGVPVSGNSQIVRYAAGDASTLRHTLTASTPGGVETATRTIELSPGIVLDKDYIPEAYATGCKPVQEPDFVLSHEYARIEPRDCASVKVRNPVFVWPEIYNATQMVLTLNFPSGKSPLQITTTRTSLILPELLSETGLYTWQVQYRLPNGQSRSGAVRRFHFDGNAVDNLPDLPTAAEVIARIGPRLHPRLIPLAADGQVMQASAIHAAVQASPLAASYKTYLAEAEQVLANTKYAMPAEPIGLKPEVIADAAFRAAQGIERLSVAALLKGDQRYHAQAIARLLQLASWAPDGATGECQQDQANRQIMLTLAQGLDMFYNNMNTADRYVLINVINQRLNPLMYKMEASLRANPYDSHVLAAAYYAVQTLMLSAGAVGQGPAGDVTFEQGAEYDKSCNAKGKPLAPVDRFTTAWETLITSSGTWGGGTDSAFGNGVSYAWNTLNAYAPALASYLLMANVDLSRIPALRQFGDNFHAQTVRNRWSKVRGTFGDGSNLTGDYESYAWNSYRLFAQVSQNPVDEWYYRDNIEQTQSFALPFHHYFLTAIRPPVEPAVLPILKRTYLFEDAGVVAMHSNTAYPQRSSLFFRSSRLGAINHSHADNNAFTFVSKGKSIFISGGIYDEFGSLPEQKIRRATRYKNALTFDAGEGYEDAGIGQAEPAASPVAPGAPLFYMQPHGRLINFHAAETSDWSVATGDATDAYRSRDIKTSVWNPLLQGAVRTVAYNPKAGVALIYDWAQSATKRRWQMNYQTLVAPVDIGAREFRVDAGDGVSVCVSYHGYDGTFSAPEKMSKVAQDTQLAWPAGEPEQYHTAYKTNIRSNSMASLIVLKEDCDAVSVTAEYLSPTKLLVKVDTSWFLFDKKAVQLSE